MGVKTAPRWVVVLDAAKEWGIPPWQMAGGSPLTWYLRYQVYRGEIADEKARQQRMAELNG